MVDLRNPFLLHEPDTPVPAGRPKVRFSHTEFRHLAMAVVALTVAFAIFDAKGQDRLLPTALELTAAFVGVGSGFVLHELAHKVVAQRYGHWAEFRSDPMNLGLALLLAVLSPIFFAAPGAVFIRGYVTVRENGFISLVGPGMNMAIAMATVPFTWVVDPSQPLPLVMARVAEINAILAIFNLLPFGPLDGRKVWRWSKVGYGVALAAAIGVAVVVWFGPF